MPAQRMLQPGPVARTAHTHAHTEPLMDVCELSLLGPAAAALEFFFSLFLFWLLS